MHHLDSRQAESGWVFPDEGDEAEIQGGVSGAHAESGVSLAGGDRHGDFQMGGRLGPRSRRRAGSPASASSGSSSTRRGGAVT